MHKTAIVRAAKISTRKLKSFVSTAIAEATFGVSVGLISRNRPVEQKETTTGKVKIEITLKVQKMIIIVAVNEFFLIIKF